MNLDYCYRLLGLAPGATPEEVNQAYRDLAFVWHPDRLPKDNPRLLAKAQHMLKELNQAREQLRHHREMRSSTTPSNGSSYSHREYPKERHSHSQQAWQTPQRPRPPRTDLSGRDFSGADLREKDFEGRNMSNCNLSFANMSDAFMHRVILENANLHGANLFRANLLGANLQGANLQDANLIGADLSGANLRGANLKGARVGYGDRIMAKFTGANLQGAILPDGTIHK